jgi:hypothetical protein
MARTVVLLSCVAQKLSEPAKARDLYQSDLFKKSLGYGESLKPNAMFILSAKHHLLPLNKVIDPYNKTLKDMNAEDRQKWADVVLSQLKNKGYDLDKDNFVILAGSTYSKDLIPHMKNYELPLKGKRIGEQKSWLKKQLGKLKETVIKLTHLLYEAIKEKSPFSN